MLTILAACDTGKKAKAVEEALRVEVFIDDQSRLGIVLGTTYGDTKVEWCNNGPATWCSSKFVHSIEDSKTVEKLRIFVNERLRGWGTPWYGAPIPTVSIRFIDAGGQVVATFASGANFFARGSASMLSISASERERREFLSLVGISEEDASSISN